MDQIITYQQLQQTQNSEETPFQADESVNEFLSQKTKLLGKKLEILVAEIVTRLDILKTNNQSLDEERGSVTRSLEKLTRLANYQLREHKDVSFFYTQLFRIEEQRRHESVEAWQDIVGVMRDLLMDWEAHESAKARGRFLNA